MSRFIPFGDMSADQIIQCSHDAMAIVALCEVAARLGSDEFSGVLSSDVVAALSLAGELMVGVHDTLEMHERSGFSKDPNTQS